MGLRNRIAGFTLVRWLYWATLVAGAVCVVQAFDSPDRVGWIVSAVLASCLAAALLELEDR